MPCRPAITHRKANGQLRQIEMTTSAKKLLCPISQNDGRLVMPSTLCSSSFTSPLLYWNMNDQLRTGSSSLFCEAWLLNLWSDLRRGVSPCRGWSACFPATVPARAAVVGRPPLGHGGPGAQRG